MSVFSETLIGFINEKDADISGMVRYCGVDRSTMYKILNGKRNPPQVATVHKLADFLHLKPDELQRLLEARKITLLGYQTYYRRKNVENFLRSFPKELHAYPDPSAKQESAEEILRPVSDLPPCLGLNSQMDVNYYLRKILAKEGHRENGNISLLVQPEYDFLLKMLQSANPPNHLTVDHIFCLTDTEAITPDHEFIPSVYMHAIFPLFARKNITFSPLNYYGDLNSRIYNPSLMPCLILTSEHAILCTRDFRRGICFSDPELISYFREGFVSLKKKCFPLFRAVPLAEDDVHAAILDLLDPSGPVSLIQPEGNLLSFLKTGESRDSLPLTRTQSADHPGTLHLFFTRHALIRFVRTGLLCEEPSSVPEPVPVPERIQVLKEFLSFCKAGHYRMLRYPLEMLPGSMRFYMTEKSGCLMLKSKDCPAFCLFLDEPSLIRTFSDYMDSLQENCYPVEEAVPIIQEMLQFLQEQV